MDLATFTHAQVLDLIVTGRHVLKGFNAGFASGGYECTGNTCNGSDQIELSPPTHRGQELDRHNQCVLGVKKLGVCV